MGSMLRGLVRTRPLFGGTASTRSFGAAVDVDRACSQSQTLRCILGQGRYSWRQPSTLGLGSTVRSKLTISGATSTTSSRSFVTDVATAGILRMRGRTLDPRLCHQARICGRRVCNVQPTTKALLHLIQPHARQLSAFHSGVRARRVPSMRGPMREVLRISCRHLASSPEKPSSKGESDAATTAPA
eukprot:2534386-Pleurochrysis_carterae.AAC.6